MLYSIGMRFLALAADYDGTLATHGRADEVVLPALSRVSASGRKLLLVTGRELGDLKVVFPQLGLFDCIVAENGGLLYRPASGEEILVCDPPDPNLIAALRGRQIPFSAGRAIIATDDEHHTAVASAIHELSLAERVHIILNKGSLMILPAGVDKSTGLIAALKVFHIAPVNVVAIGDAENDIAMLAVCGCGAAVANALPQVKRDADLVTVGRHGAGVVEVIDELLANDLSRYGLRHVRG